MPITSQHPLAKCIFQGMRYGTGLCNIREKWKLSTRDITQPNPRHSHWKNIPFTLGRMWTKYLLISCYETSDIFPRHQCLFFSFPIIVFSKTRVFVKKKVALKCYMEWIRKTILSWSKNNFLSFSRRWKTILQYEISRSYFY